MAKEFSALAGEAHTLENIAATDEKEIDPEYLEDFRQLKKEIHTYLEKQNKVKITYSIPPYFTVFKPT